MIIDGKKYHYTAVVPPEEQARGVIIFVHGAGGNHRHWLHQVAHVGRHLLAFAVDLPGHGFSEGQAYSSISEYSEFVYQFARRVTAMPFFLAGHSMGGAIALDLAVKYQDMLQGLILIGTGAKLKVLPELLQTFGNGRHHPVLLEYLYARNVSSEIKSMAEKEYYGTSPDIFFHDFCACDSFDIRDRLNVIEVPALILSGEHDVMTPVKYGDYLAQRISNSRHLVIPTAGHMLMLENPAAVNTAIIDFVLNN
ncbi:alpha/beta fold hydrolase [Desulfurispora thermophila]|uniref:alpha/beta fold hydrolase n=1 Tax=Desulfurispora thermophila TaxID=265470 RepID=UPI001FA7A972|nr:alpha/beta hydrolase [Desulfurispora thermophila]